MCASVVIIEYRNMKTRNTKFFRREIRKYCSFTMRYILRGRMPKFKRLSPKLKNVSRKCVKRNTKTEKRNSKQDLNFENLFSVSQISTVY